MFYLGLLCGVRLQMSIVAYAKHTLEKPWVGGGGMEKRGMFSGLGDRELGINSDLGTVWYS